MTRFLEKGGSLDTETDTVEEDNVKTHKNTR